MMLSAKSEKKGHGTLGDCFAERMQHTGMFLPRLS